MGPVVDRVEFTLGVVEIKTRAVVDNLLQDNACVCGWREVKQSVTSELCEISKSTVSPAAVATTGASGLKTLL